MSDYLCTSRFNGNSIEYAQKDAVKTVNVAMIKMMDNYLGFPISLPAVLVTYVGGAGAACRAGAGLDWDKLGGVTFIGNMAARADWSLLEVGV